ncbi:uncharacterized protein Pyn_10466 [Prunus yedoensis var. nudiflora]|uniref:Aminotransferase-like plant mobile domain-containing protein n=1 Tax=Prunus yedoensis var. nudiflora TaxID=2094558 RepID=A0A314ZLH4_PRUYE|nr:uncharacterized protein Pyn_10466 [Prunus yedoensis var. nudiflora]
MNFQFDMMTPTILDMAALFGLSPLGVEVNAALVAPEVEGSFKTMWPALTRLAENKAKNMLNYSSFYSNFGVRDSAEDDVIAPLGEVEHAAFLLYWLCKFVFCTQANKVTLEFAHLADYLAQGGRLALGPFLLGHIYRTLHEIITDGMKPKHAPKKHNTSTLCYKFFYSLAERTGTQFRVCLTRPFPLDLGLLPSFARPSLRPVQGWGRGVSAKLRGAAVRPNSDGPAPSSVNQPALVLEGRCLSSARRGWHNLPASTGNDLPDSNALVAP